MESNVQAVAQTLMRARKTHRQADAHGSAEWVLDSADEACAVQDAMGRELDWWHDGVPGYWKTGAANLQALQTSSPLPDAGIWSSGRDVQSWPMHQRGVESEIAFRTARAVTAQEAATLDADTACGVIDAMTVAIELVDFRWQQQMGAPEWLKLADLQSHGALVLGAWIPFAARDWSAQICRTVIGDQAEVRRTGTHSLGDPTLVLPGWLRHATARFGTVPAGTVVTTGTWVGLLFAHAGDLVRTEFDGIGAVSVRV